MRLPPDGSNNILYVGSALGGPEMRSPVLLHELLGGLAHFRDGEMEALVTCPGLLPQVHRGQGYVAAPHTSPTCPDTAGETLIPGQKNCLDK